MSTTDNILPEIRNPAPGAGAKVHLVGVGGVGMAGLAVLLQSRGCSVSGCDLSASPRTRWLASLGIEVAIGHDPSHVEDSDLVVVTPAVDRRNPELAAAKAPVRFRGEVLAELANGRDTIAVCGSHGKTTTSTWIAKLLLALGEDAAWCIGGETGDFPVAGTGSGPLVVEADESDGTLALYRAQTLVVNRCEYDHPDHFKTPEAYFACYRTAMDRAQTVIEAESLDSIEGLPALEGLAPHNRRNARAAIEVALRRGHRLEDIAAALPAVVSRLPDRRFQLLWPDEAAPAGGDDFKVVADYAHHPTEMACAIGMARQICTGRLRVLFQPHRYSRTKALIKDFPQAFALADEVVLCPTYAAFEPPVEGGDIADLYRACRERFAAQSGEAPRLYLARSCREAWEHAFNSRQPGDVALVLGAGDIIALADRIRHDCGGGSQEPPRRIWQGQGSNTWRSDLNLRVEYVPTQGPAGAPGVSLGIPWMMGIPGTVGGWIKMNAGAFGHSISEVLDAVKVDGNWMPASECGFAYRHSDIAGEIQDFRLKGEAELRELCREPASAYLARRKRFPAGTYGSIFKNPPGDFAGRLLEAAGAKALRVGGAYVWDGHANVIVRGEGATQSDVLALFRLMRNRVRFRFGVELEPEVCGLEAL